MKIVEKLNSLLEATEPYAKGYYEFAQKVEKELVAKLNKVGFKRIDNKADILYAMDEGTLINYKSTFTDGDTKVTITFSFDIGEDWSHFHYSTKDNKGLNYSDSEKFKTKNGHPDSAGRLAHVIFNDSQAGK